MKTFVKIFLLIVVLVVLATAVFAASPATVKEKDSTSISLKPTHYRDLLILKSDKTYMGASVEVHDSTGAVVASSHIQKRKMIIDFYNIPYGTYTICVVKNKKTLEFKYTKEQDSEILN